MVDSLDHPGREDGFVLLGRRSRAMLGSASTRELEALLVPVGLQYDEVSVPRRLYRMTERTMP